MNDLSDLWGHGAKLREIVSRDMGIQPGRDITYPYISRHFIPTYRVMYGVRGEVLLSTTRLPSRGGRAFSDLALSTSTAVQVGTVAN